MSFVVRWIACACAVAVAVWLLPGIGFLYTGSQMWVNLALFSLILSLVNVSVKPVLQILSLPITILSLGIFYLIINTVLIYFAAWLANSIFGVNFFINGFLSAFFASIIISIVSSIVNSLLSNN